MGIFLGWIIGCFVIGFIGSGRKIGFGGAFFLSLLLSPILGLIITLVSKDKENEAFKQQLLQNISENDPRSSADELAKIADLKEKNIITDEEYQTMKDRIINN